MAAYMKYPDIKGESKEPNHYEWIDLLSVNWGAGRNAGSNELTVSKYYDNASPRLQQDMLQGNPREVGIALAKDEGQGHGDQDYLVLTLKGAIISGLQAASDKELVTFNFTSVENRYIKAYGYGDKTGDFSEPE